MNDLKIEWRNLERVLNEYADYFIQTAQERLRTDNSVATGELLSSMEKIILIDDDKFSVRVSLEDYWKYLNYGTRPHYPPIRVLKDWVEVKHIQPYGDMTKQQLPYAIQQSIGKYGTKPTHFFDDVYNDTYERFISAIEYAIEEDIAEFIENEVLKMFQDL